MADSRRTNSFEGAIKSFVIFFGISCNDLTISLFCRWLRRSFFRVRVRSMQTELYSVAARHWTVPGIPRLYALFMSLWGVCFHKWSVCTYPIYLRNLRFSEIFVEFCEVMKRYLYILFWFVPWVLILPFQKLGAGMMLVHGQLWRGGC